MCTCSSTYLRRLLEWHELSIARNKNADPSDWDRFHLCGIFKQISHLAGAKFVAVKCSKQVVTVVHGAATGKEKIDDGKSLFTMHTGPGS